MQISRRHLLSTLPLLSLSPTPRGRTVTAPGAYDANYLTGRDAVMRLMRHYERRLRGQGWWAPWGTRPSTWTLPDLSEFGPFQIYPSPISVADYRQLSPNLFALWLIPYQDPASALTPQRVFGMCEAVGF